MHWHSGDELRARRNERDRLVKGRDVCQDDDHLNNQMDSWSRHQPQLPVRIMSDVVDGCQTALDRQEELLDQDNCLGFSTAAWITHKRAEELKSPTAIHSQTIKPSALLQSTRLK
jgi:hypothetical protein